MHKRLEIERLYAFSSRPIQPQYYAKEWPLCESIFAARVYVVSCYDSSVGDNRLDLC